MSFTEDRLLVQSRQYQRYEFDARASAPYTLEDRFYTVAMHVNVSEYEGRIVHKVIADTDTSYLRPSDPKRAYKVATI